MTTFLRDGAYERFERKISDIQVAIDSGLLSPDKAINSLREVRIELFSLRELLKTEIVFNFDDPNSPNAA